MYLMAGIVLCLCYMWRTGQFPTQNVLVMVLASRNPKVTGLSPISGGVVLCGEKCPPPIFQV